MLKRNICIRKCQRHQSIFFLNLRVAEDQWTKKAKLTKKAKCLFDVLSTEFGEGNGTPLQYSCLENPMDREAWQAADHGVTKSLKRLSDFTFHFSLSCIGEGNGNPLQCSCLENPRDGGAWWAAVYGVAQRRTRLKQRRSSSSSSSSSSKHSLSYVI